jgi:hypothetical protein
MKTKGYIRLLRKYTLLLAIALCMLAPLRGSAQRHGRPLSYSRKEKTVLLTVEGRIAKKLYLSEADLHSYSRSTVQLNRGSSEPSLYEGIPLIEILRKAGAPLGGQIKEEARSYVEAIARDGTHVIFSLAELDPAFANSSAFVVDMPGGPPSSHAELLLIVGTDKVALRTVPHLTTIRVQRLR